MERIFTIEDAREKLERRLAYYNDRVEAWEKVERVSKKNGEDFARLSANFTNCDIVKSWMGDELTIHFRGKYEGHVTDYITLTGNAYGVEDADTADKVQERIKARVEQYKGYIETTKAGLETIAEQIEAIKPQLEALKQAIKEAEKVDCNYILGSYIKEYLRIL